MPEILRLLKDQFKTPIGEMVIAVDHDGNLRAVDWADYADRMLNLLRPHYGKNGFTLEAAQNPGGLTQTMKSYFAEELSSIDAVL
jgi:methylated-DNA-[protein]-cysteine S-methyltransferase